MTKLLMYERYDRETDYIETLIGDDPETVEKRRLAFGRRRYYARRMICYQDGQVTIYNSDSAKMTAKEVPDESVDLLVTDPPYGIAFMGKNWDKALPDRKVWEQCYRALKPGAFAFVMSIPRSDCLSRMILSLESVGFRVDFTPIYWAYASGFPKAQNIGKAIDKRLGAEREVVGTRHRNVKPYDDAAGWNQNDTQGDYEYTSAGSPEAQALDGSYAGFQPKPAVEVIIVAMKPLSEKTYVDQALANGHGVTWLDAGRIPHNGKTPGGTKGTTALLGGGITDRAPVDQSTGRFPANLLCSDDVLNDGEVTKSGVTIQPEFVSHNAKGFQPNPKAVPGVNQHSDSGSFSRYYDLDAWWEERVKRLPESVRKVLPFLVVAKASKEEKNEGVDAGETVVLGHNRFDKCANCGGYLLQNPDRPSACKCDDPVREPNTLRGNVHPTVKPLKLFAYLITLGSRPGDMVMDTFGGSMTAGVAAKLLNRKAILFDKDQGYCQIGADRCRQTIMALDVDEEVVVEDTSETGGVPKWMLM